MRDDTHSSSRIVVRDIRRRGMQSFFSLYLAGVMGIPFRFSVIDEQGIY